MELRDLLIETFVGAVKKIIRPDERLGRTIQLFVSLAQLAQTLFAYARPSILA